MDNIHITCSTDDNYVQHCMAMLCSVLENNSNHKVYIHLLHHGLSFEKQQLISHMVERYSANIYYYNVDINQLSKVTIADYHPNLSIATYFRFFLPFLLDTSIEKVLYLDCDVIVLKDISELFCIDLTGYGVAGVKDVTPESDTHRRVMGLELDGRAFCAGVLMINLEYWRENNCGMKLLKFASEMSEQLFMEDQDALNYEFRRHWFQLPYKYGYTPMSIAPLDKVQKWNDILEYVLSPSIIHYAGQLKPWLDIRIPSDQYYWKYVKLSGFPSPKEIRCLDIYRSNIRKAKIRYYLNYYIHPFVPNIIDVCLKDFINILVLFTYAFKWKKFKEYRLKCWLRKYDMR